MATNFSVIENKISATQKYLTILDDYQNYTASELADSNEKRGALERYLYLAIQSAIDLAEAIVSYKNWRKPETLGETFSVLAENRLISNDLADKLIRMVGFRNIIAHDYEKINYEIVLDVLQNRLSDIEGFLKIADNL